MGMESSSIYLIKNGRFLESYVAVSLPQGRSNSLGHKLAEILKYMLITTIPYDSICMWVS